MLMISPAVRIFIAAEAVNMHLSFDRLAALVREGFGEDPLSGHLFVFRNRRGDKAKILLWDRCGFVIWYKRLERGVFNFAQGVADGCAEVEAAELALLLEGIELKGARRRPRFQLKRAESNIMGPAGSPGRTTQLPGRHPDGRQAVRVASSR